MRHIVFGLIALALVACSSTSSAPIATPQTPAQVVYALEGTYQGALGVELAYAKLPPCGNAASAICSSTTVLTQIVNADKDAWTTLQAAQTAVQTPGFNDSATTASIASAQAAVNAFAKLTSTLKVN